MEIPTKKSSSILTSILLVTFLFFISCAGGPGPGEAEYGVSYPDQEQTQVTTQAPGNQSDDESFMEPKSSSGEYQYEQYEGAEEARAHLGRGNAFVSPLARRKIYKKVAVMPFRAPVELVGASIADMFATELLRTYKYQLVERSQMEKVLGEQALGLKGVTDSATAVKVGKMLGVQGVIVGTVPEYGYRAMGPAKLPSIGLNIRMIDVTDGTIVWSITNSGLSHTPTSLSAFAERLIRQTVPSLIREMVRSSDTYAVNLPSPQVVSYKGGIRTAKIEVLADSPRMFRGYKLLRSRSARGPFRRIASIRNTGERKTITFLDRKLLDSETYYYKVAAVARNGLNGNPAGPYKVTTAGPPGAVQSLHAKSGMIRKITLTWAPPADPHVRGYKIYRKAPGGNWGKLEYIEGKNHTTYIDEGLKDGATYQYRIMAVNVVGVESRPSQVISATTQGPPSAVTGFSAQSNQPRMVTLTWNPVLEPAVKGYTIYRAEKETGPFKEIVFIEGKDNLKYVDKGESSGFWSNNEPNLKDYTRYYYKIHSVNVVDVHSPDSPVISAVTKPVPVAVAGLRASQLEPRRVTLQWQPNPESDIESYEIFRSEGKPNDFDDIVKVSSDMFRYVDKERDDGTTYYYKVRAIDKDGLIGKFSEIVSSKTKPIPKTPSKLNAQIVGTQIILTWQPNPEPDIRKYVIYKMGFFSKSKVGETPQPTFTFKGEKGKSYRFKIVAIDSTDLESNESEEINVDLKE